MITSFFTAGGRLEKVDEVDDGRGDSVVEGVGVDTFESVEYVKTFESVCVIKGCDIDFCDAVSDVVHKIHGLAVVEKGDLRLNHLNIFYLQTL